MNLMSSTYNSGMFQNTFTDRAMCNAACVQEVISMVKEKSKRKLTVTSIQNNEERESVKRRIKDEKLDTALKFSK